MEAQAAQQAAMQAVESESKQQGTTEPSAVSQINFGAYGKRAVSFLARNFYNLKLVALVLAFCINFMLLFYKVKLIELPSFLCQDVWIKNTKNSPLIPEVLTNSIL